MEEAAFGILIPVMEFAMYSASKYANACSRNTVTATDMQYGMKYAARNYVGKQIGSHFSDDEDSESETESVSEYESEEDEFTRYTGDDEIIQDMNSCFDSWDEWAPESPAEIMLKEAIDAQTESVFPQ